MINDLDLLIDLHKEHCTCTNHSISNFVSYYLLSPSYSIFIFTLSQYPIYKTIFEALHYLG